jgi:hypothetical protein
MAKSPSPSKLGGWLEPMPSEIICPCCGNDILHADTLLGTAEVAELLAVERPRIGRWRALGLIREPIAELAATPVWRSSQIEAMREDVERRRKPRKHQ